MEQLGNILEQKTNKKILEFSKILNMTLVIEIRTRPNIAD